MKLEGYKNLTDEEKSDMLMDSLSDSVRKGAHQIAMLKAIAKEEQGITPEDFDKAWTKEFDKEWNKLKDKKGHELALIGLLEMITDGASVEEIFVESEEK